MITPKDVEMEGLRKENSWKVLGGIQGKDDEELK